MRVDLKSGYSQKLTGENMKTFKKFYVNKLMSEVMAAPDAAPAQDPYQASADYVQSYTDFGKELVSGQRKYGVGSEASPQNLADAMKDVGHKIFQLKHIEQQGGTLTPAQKKEMEKAKDVLSQLSQLHYKALLKQAQPSSLSR